MGVTFFLRSVLFVFYFALSTSLFLLQGDCMYLLGNKRINLAVSGGKLVCRRNEYNERTEKKDNGDLHKLWQHNRGNYTTQNNFFKEKNTTKKSPTPGCEGWRRAQRLSFLPRKTHAFRCCSPREPLLVVWQGESFRTKKKNNVSAEIFANALFFLAHCFQRVLRSSYY